MDLELKGKTAVITGGSIGIGLAVAEKFAGEGANVAVCARNEDRLIKVTADIEQQYGVKTLGFAADVTNPGDITAFAKKIEETFGSADILVNNAGTGSNETIMEATDEKWQYYWDLHLMAAVRLSRAIVPLMKKNNSGVIINNASICARQPLWYEPIYNTTKAALVMFSKCLAHELVGDNIRVNTISPGLVLTPDWKKTATQLSEERGITPDEYLDGIAKEHAPIGRFASPEELADFFVFLASPRASYSIGSTYYVDGGWLRVTS